jgi:hypothetical protein
MPKPSFAQLGSRCWTISPDVKLWCGTNHQNKARWYVSFAALPSLNVSGSFTWNISRDQARVMLSMVTLAGGSNA